MRRLPNNNELDGSFEFCIKKDEKTKIKAKNKNRKFRNYTQKQEASVISERNKKRRKKERKNIYNI